MHAFPRSALLLLQDNAISSVIPSTLTDQIDVLLDDHRIDDAAQLVDQRRKELEGNLTLDPDEAEELQYAFQAIGFTCFSETLFEDAGRNLFNGALDPRVLISYYPDLHGRLFSSDDQVDVYSGVAARMPQEKSVDDLIAMNLVRNYSPHLSPNIREAPPAVELTRVLSAAAREMLLVFLEKSRKRARVEDIDGAITRVVDTVLSKLYAHFTRHKDLTTLLSEPNNVALPEIESSLRTFGLLSPLANLYKQRGEDDKLIELYAGCVEGAFPSSDIQNPLEDMLALLESRKDGKDRAKWGLWMLKKGDVDRGIKLLIPLEAPKRRDKDRDKEEDRELLEQITEVNAKAGRRYLEYLALTKRNTSPDLHTRLALSCIDDLLQCLQDESIAKLWRAKASSFASPRPSPPPPNPSSYPPISPPSPQPQQSTSTPSSPSPTLLLSSSPPLPPPPFSRPLPRHSHSHQTQQQQSFLSYFASTTPDSASKRTRLKAVLVLSGSGLYDAQLVQKRLVSGIGPLSRLKGPSDGKGKAREREEFGQRAGKSGSGNVLALEYAILEGKLGNHAEALSTLVHDLRDTTSAEAYCALGGEVVPAKQALSIVESMSDAGPLPSSSLSEGLSLKEWYFGLFEPAVSPRTKKSTGLRTNTGVVGAEASAIVRQKSVKEEVKNALLMDLVGVYMSDVANGADRTQRLLDSQGVNLDAVDVITLVPDEWALSTISTFLMRHFRRATHARLENTIVKNVSLAQNITISESTYWLIREQGGTIEESDSDEKEDDVEGREEQEAVGSNGEKAVHLQAAELVEKFVEREETPSPSSTEDDDKESTLGLILDAREEERNEFGKP